jgi:hypothetical protein
LSRSDVVNLLRDRTRALQGTTSQIENESAKDSYRIHAAMQRETLILDEEQHFDEMIWRIQDACIPSCRFVHEGLK